MSTVTATRGVLGTKLGMTQVWDANNQMIPVFQQTAKILLSIKYAYHIRIL